MFPLENLYLVLVYLLTQNLKDRVFSSVILPKFNILFNSEN